MGILGRTPSRWVLSCELDGTFRMQRQVCICSLKAKSISLGSELEEMTQFLPSPNFLLVDVQEAHVSSGYVPHFKLELQCEKQFSGRLLSACVSPGVFVGVFIVVKRHHDHGNSYFIEVDVLQFGGSVSYHHGRKHGNM